MPNNRRNTTNSANRRNTTSGTPHRPGAGSGRASGNSASNTAPRANIPAVGPPSTEMVPLDQVDVEKPGFILDALADKTFVVVNTRDVEIMRKLIKANQQLAPAITSISLPKLFWFSGIKGSRTDNETLQLASELPNLTHLSITLHTAGLTKPKWSEFQQNSIEKYDVNKSKQRVPLTADEVVYFYDLRKIPLCKQLRFLRIECYDSAMIRQQTPSADPLAVFFELRQWFTSAFQGSHRPVIQLQVNPGERDYSRSPG